MSEFHSSGELVDPVALAERILDKCDAGQADPDSDIAILARQFLRSNERIEMLTKVPLIPESGTSFTQEYCAIRQTTDR